MKTVDEQTLEWWVMGTPGTICGVPNNHYLRWDDSDPLNGHYEETEHLRKATTFETKEDAGARHLQRLVRRLQLQSN